MVRVALLIGVSEDGPNNPRSRPKAQQNIETMRQVLQHPEIGRFAEVKTLINPDRSQMRSAIETQFADREKYDLVLLYFSGCAFQDERNQLYFATGTAPPQTLNRSTALAASFLQDTMSKSDSEQQVVILDCFLTGAASLPPPEGLGSDTVGREGQVVLRCFTPRQFFEQLDSIYTRYLVEGIKTGAADLDNDGVVSVKELHEYTSWKVQKSAPAIKPECWVKEDHNKLVLAKAPVDDPRLRYRKQVERFARDSDISTVNRRTLDVLQEKLGLLPKEAKAIEADVLQPHQEYQQKLQHYAQALAQNTQQKRPQPTPSRLKALQQKGADADGAPVEAQAGIASSPDPVSSTTQTPVTLRPEPVILPAARSARLWEASPAFQRPARLLIGLGVAAILVLIAVVISPLARKAPEPESTPVPNNVPPIQQPPSPTPLPTLPLTSPLELPSLDLPEAPAPQPSPLDSALPPILPATPSKPATPKPAKRSSTPPKPKSVAPAKPKPVAPTKPRRILPPPSPSLTLPEPPPTPEFEPPPTSAPSPSLEPEAPPTSWAEPPPSSAPDSTF